MIPISRRIRGLRRAAVNPDAVQELLDYLDANKKQLLPANKRLVEFIVKGQYSKDHAEKVFGPLVQQFSRRYYAQYGDESLPYSELFSVGTIKEVVSQWIKRFERETKNGRYNHLKPKRAAADNGKLVELAPEVNDRSITGNDLYNLRLLAQRFCDGEEWQHLFNKTWETRSDLVQELLGYIPQRIERRRFRNMVDELWVRNNAN